MPAPSRESQRRLSAAPLREFIQVRDALARELRGKGEVEEAKAVAAVRKPPAGLWLANRTAQLAAAEVKALVEATARLRQVQSSARSGASGEALRAAMRDQREALARLADATGRAAREAGTTLTLALQRRVQNTLQAAAASEPEALLEGSLAAELLPSGFEGVFGAGPVAEPAALAERQAAAGRAGPAASKKGDERAQRPRKDEARRAEEERTRKRELAARERALARALRAAEKEARRLESAAKKLTALAGARERQAADARERAEAARRSADQAAARALELRQKRA